MEEKNIFLRPSLLGIRMGGFIAQKKSAAGFSLGLKLFQCLPIPLSLGEGCHMPFEQNEQIVMKEAVSGQTVKHPDPLPTVFDELHMAQRGQMARDGGLGEGEDFHKIAHAQLSLGEKGHDPQPCFIGKGFEGSGSRFHGHNVSA